MNLLQQSHTGDNIGWRGGLHFGQNSRICWQVSLAYFGPILFAFLLIAAVRFWREGWDRAQKLLVMFSLPVLGLITIQALMSKGLC